MKKQLVWLLVLLAGCSGPQMEPEDKRQNVVVFLADDQGWGDLSIHGNSNLSTPAIDSLARNGALFENFYVCRVCAPTRAEFLTGRYHSRGGVTGVSQGKERLNIDEVTIANVFKSAGYATGAFGKWHNGTQGPYHPNARGFDEFYGFTSGHWGQYFDPVLEHNGNIVRGKGFIIDDFTDHAIRFIEQNKDRPFFCYLPFNTPHSPMQVPDRFYERFRDKALEMRHRDPDLEDIPKSRAALAMVENIDWNVARVLKKLDDLDLAENTIVLFFSDNGPNSWRWNGGMKGRKGSIDEGGLRVPLIIRWPGQIEPGVQITQVASAIDLLPTLSEMAGVPLQANQPLDGISLKELLLDRSAVAPDRKIFSYHNQRGEHQVSVRTNQYRLDAQGRLYDIVQDRGQTTDIAAQEPEVAAELRQASAHWLEQILPSISIGPRPFPVGFSERTLLPARDGIPHGNINRSAGAPNCSFFTGWNSIEDRMSWDVEVVTPGDYEVVIYYTCPEADVGSTVELSFGENRLVDRVSEAHDPPLVGAAYDRVPRRGESYVKDFKALSLGAISLSKGRGELTLRALEIPGTQVMDVRSIMLIRVEQ